ncbi:MAG: glycoside hydrolase family 3 N-terminal domain-containing protein [Streptosporangiaceae bacterium]|jgi:beta-N-acetylhexosaminidase
MSGNPTEAATEPVTRRTVMHAAGAVLAVGGLAAFSRTNSAASPALTPRQLAGQRVIYSYTGLTVPDSLLDQIKAGLAGGVIFYGDNISSLSQIAAAINELEKARLASPVKTPLLLMTDQEGGEVRRLPGAPVLSEKEIGESKHPVTEAREAGEGAGKLLRSVGMNVNLAPVLDVYRKAGDFDDQYQRSYSNNPKVCAECGQAFITAQQLTGVAATSKHFPGLGAATASEDTDVEPVTLDVSLNDLRTIDELPYHSAIAAGVKLILVSWAVYPALDPKYPAGLSSRIVQGELRDRLGFRGVTITDALEAGALEHFGSTAERSVLAAQAGMDVIMCASQDVSQGEQAVASLASAYESKKLPQAQFLDAVNRILALRKTLP